MTLDADRARTGAPERLAEKATAVYRAGPAPVMRTLCDIFAETVREHPDALALDDGIERATYRDFAAQVEELAGRLRAAGVRPGDRVGIRMTSGTAALYRGILAVLSAGAAYVPVDADDPADRAGTVWTEARVSLVLSDAGLPPARGPQWPRVRPQPQDDAWIIFTSGSTGKPKGVAVTHRAAAAFADAEARLFCTARPLGPGDRVLAGLSVAFDASCEEMWLAWRHGACLVPAPRSLVRAGADLGPWLVERGVTVVSTVPTLAALWPVDTLAGVRLLILGGEACPPEVVTRFDDGKREIWNTYGPTETTVVACAQRLHAGEPVRIGLPLAGWDLAVVDPEDPAGIPVPWGRSGELVIGGVGLARYLDAAKDAQKFVPLPGLGWSRAYRSGDLVRAVPEGLEFVGRADGQVKIGGRRVELGEIDAALRALPGVAAAATVVRRTDSGAQVLVGYVVPEGESLDRTAARGLLRDRLPAALVPRLALVPELPVRASGKLDRDALPWPLEEPAAAPVAPSDPKLAWLLRVWSEHLAAAAGPDDDFFDLGGSSVTAARLVSALRERYPSAAVSDVYSCPTPRELYERLAGAPAETVEVEQPQVAPVRGSGWWQAGVQLVLLALSGMRWLLSVSLLGSLVSLVLPLQWLPRMSWWILVPAWLVLLSPPGRMLLAAGGVRMLRGKPAPGEYRRGGIVHMRLWTAERFAAVAGPPGVAGTPLAAPYARLLGNRVGRGVDLHAPPPVSGLADFGDGCAIEPEADLAGWWLDGAVLRIGRVRVGAGARAGGRSTLLPGTDLGAGSVLLPGSTLDTRVPDGAVWGGSPAGPAGERPSRPTAAAPRAKRYLLAFALGGTLRSMVLFVSAIPLGAVALLLIPAADDPRGAALAILPWTPLLVLAGIVVHALTIVLLVRLAGLAVRPGVYPVLSRAGWAAWFVHELLEIARRQLFPLYAALATPVWMRLLGARIGRGVELSTVLSLPSLLRVRDGAFLADDVLAAPYELDRGWVRLGVSEVGERAFVGNSAVVGPGRTLGSASLVGVLSDTPADVPDGTSWLGRPALELRRSADTVDPARTFAPPRRVKLARALVESCRIAPLLIAGLLALAVSAVLTGADIADGFWTAAALAPAVFVSAGLFAALLTTLMKWTLVGRFRPGRHPLWSAFVWRNELYDTFVETLAVPWFAGSFLGTPVLNWWLRTLGARIGRGVWCESYWLPETDLVHLGDGAVVNRGCVLQTHLFHDRVMRLDPVRLGSGATLGPRAFQLPGSAISEGATVGSGSLVMAGETVPPRTRWRGTPVRPWK
ncbi:amino acid adenylation domain-containing protein [Amycolatopsis rubida]|uniref:Amino acid adenylation domain-containing protein n=1 Tax=Amycolatopsis rubida TaxID=112413 RepID=A0ABX0BJV7_9PSEU|nr:Pls/PosA family non-ribosomal peptide synthetase [Amycolatopsis sp. M39]MYW90639.1 amino acid adenylation domain-containing protein [Amycolatopsis rubida]NEC55620.1 amino acid adenylation domain-containing protein [Amycolatopsis rubida]OAP29115.1 Linear gramicidin synthase subunit D [Amycolatopsis sp. M39]